MYNFSRILSTRQRNKMLDMSCRLTLTNTTVFLQIRWYLLWSWRENFMNRSSMILRSWDWFRKWWTSKMRIKCLKGVEAKEITRIYQSFNEKEKSNKEIIAKNQPVDFVLFLSCSCNYFLKMASFRCGNFSAIPVSLKVWLSTYSNPGATASPSSP